MSYIYLSSYWKTILLALTTSTLSPTTQPLRVNPELLSFVETENNDLLTSTQRLRYALTEERSGSVGHSGTSVGSISVLRDGANQRWEVMRPVIDIDNGEQVTSHIVSTNNADSFSMLDVDANTAHEYAASPDGSLSLDVSHRMLSVRGPDIFLLACGNDWKGLSGILEKLDRAKAYYTTTDEPTADGEILRIVVYRGAAHDQRGAEYIFDVKKNGILQKQQIYDVAGNVVQTWEISAEQHGRLWLPATCVETVFKQPIRKSTYKVTSVEVLSTVPAKQFTTASLPFVNGATVLKEGPGLPKAEIFYYSGGEILSLEAYAMLAEDHALPEQDHPAPTTEVSTAHPFEPPSVELSGDPSRHQRQLIATYAVFSALTATIVYLLWKVATRHGANTKK